jgi:integrase/recombinase XerD
MPRKGHRTSLLVVGDRSDPEALGALLGEFLESLAVRNYSPGTINKRRLDLNKFVGWAERRDLRRAVEITRTILTRYQQYLAAKRDEHERPLSIRTQHSRLCSVRGWFRWLARERYVRHNPASELELPRLPQRLPQRILTAREVEAVLARPNVDRPLGLRDRAILETFYSSGIRRMELARLQAHDVDAERGVLTVRQGKGQKDRVVPIGARALAWLTRYQLEVRPQLAVRTADPTLYLTRLGDAFSNNSLTLLVRCYIKKSGIAVGGSCHLFRHAMATAMHERGADIRFLQAILGHARLETTQIYTHVSIPKLKEVHQRTHPAWHIEPGSAS